MYVSSCGVQVDQNLYNCQFWWCLHEFYYC